MLAAVGHDSSCDVVLDRFADLGEVCEGGSDVDGVPADNSVGEQCEALRLEVLVVGSSSLELAEAREEEPSSQSVERFPLVELDEDPAAVLLVVQVAHERDRLDDPPVLLDCFGQIVLARRRLEPGDEQRCRVVAVPDGGGPAEKVVPSVEESLGSDVVSEQAGGESSGRCGGESPEALVGDVADAWGELEAAEIEQAEDEVGVAGGVGRVFFDGDVEVGFVVEDCIEDVGGFAFGGLDHPCAVLGVLVRGPGVDRGALAGVVLAHCACGRPERQIVDGCGLPGHRDYRALHPGRTVARVRPRSPRFWASISSGSRWEKAMASATRNADRQICATGVQ